MVKVGVNIRLYFDLLIVIWLVLVLMLFLLIMCMGMVRLVVVVCRDSRVKGRVRIDVMVCFFMLFFVLG